MANIKDIGIVRLIKRNDEDKSILKMRSELKKGKLSCSKIVKTYNEVNGTNLSVNSLFLKLFIEVFGIEVSEEFYNTISKLNPSWNSIINKHRSNK